LEGRKAGGRATPDACPRKYQEPGLQPEFNQENEAMSSSSTSIPKSRSFEAIKCKDGVCPGAKYHFHGCAREVYTYLEFIREKDIYGGFLFMKIDNIVEHTKDWNNDGKPFTKRQVYRVLEVFRTLGVLGPYETRPVRGRAVRGRQFGNHGLWSEIRDGVCQFVYPMTKPSVTSDVTPDVTVNVTSDVTLLEQNVTLDVTPLSDILALNLLTWDELKNVFASEPVEPSLAFEPNEPCEPLEPWPQVEGEPGFWLANAISPTDEVEHSIGAVREFAETKTQTVNAHAS
jgi:hypothetical protein